jgi:hypothetical protein
MGMLKDVSGEPREAFVLDGTTLLPSLKDRSWEKGAASSPLSPAQKLDLRRARLRVEILKRESDPTSKFELFQRLNTGGASLSEQEVRNCTLVMINPELQKWIEKLSVVPSFNQTIRLTEAAMEKQLNMELVLRFLAFRHTPYRKGLDVHDYLDHASITIARDQKFPADREREIFIDTFDSIHTALGDKAFRRWEGSKFTGKFLMSVFEVLAFGLSMNLSKVSKLSSSQRGAYIQKRAKDLWDEDVFRKYSGPGVRGSDRLSHLLPMAKEFMKP